MKNSVAIFLQDLRNIKRVPLVGMLFIGLAILPSLYAWFNLSAAWDPYGNTGGVSVAVVNEDAGAEVDGERIDIGEELEESLMTNDQLGWTMVEDEETATDGVKSGDYYAAVMIPEDFSSSLVAVLDGDPQQSAVTYVVNEKVNAIAPKMTDTGASTITREINEQFSAETSRLMFALFDELGIQLEEELPTFRAMKDVVFELEGMMGDARQFGDTIIALEEEWDELDDYAQTIQSVETYIPAIEAYAEGVVALDDSFDEITEQSETILTLESELDQFEAALDGLNRLQASLPEWNEEVEAVFEEGESLQGESDRLMEELNLLEEQADKFLQELDEAAVNYETATDFAEDGMIRLDSEAEQFSQSLEALEDRLKDVEDHEAWDKLEAAAGEVQENIDTYLDTLHELEAVLLWLEEHVADADVTPALEAVQRQLERLESWQVTLDDMAEKLEEGDVSEEQIDRWLEQLDDAADAIASGIERLEENEGRIERLMGRAVESIAEEVERLEEEELEAYLTGFLEFSEDALKETERRLEELDEWLSTIDGDDVDDALIEQVRALSDQLQTVEALLASVTTGLEAFAAYDVEGQLAEGLAQLDDVIDRLTTLQQQLAEVEEALSGASHPVEPLTEEASETITDTRRQVDDARSWLMGDGVDFATDVDEEIRRQGDRLYDALDMYQSLVADMQSALEQGQESIASGFTSAREVTEATMPEAEQRLNALTEELNARYPELERRVTTLARFVREDLPVVERQVHSLSQWMQEELPEIREDYERVNDWLEEDWPAVSEGVEMLSAFASEDLPVIDEEIRSVSDTVRELEEDEQIQEMISVLRNDLAEEEAFFAEPVVLDENQLFPIPNYGSANVPFYTPLTLWVGALLLSNLVTTNLHEKDQRAGFTLRQIYVGRGLLFMVIAILQGLIVSLGNLHLLGVYAAHPVWLVVFSVLIALVFMTIVYTFASILGNIGKAIAIVFLVLQLSGGGGTFPIEVTPPFFQAIHPFLPFTYAINLLREAVGGMIVSNVLYNLAILGGFWVLSLVIGLLLKPILEARITETYQKSKSSRLVE
ncbi:YhgE/Pip domain-containing protein [Salisediminibacterium beveridgei]|uniref:Phage infection protein n=1 Tax=Salisediminibacterium beveridgei TaxID=632773 RepID=A0A1D7QSG6_9BACI|nr:YhgE/Pip domain-containing protein [Salisediminibacterium beveridgei]AOM81919.1 Phage infection protein [Salisediminibacterium beveridgei]